MRIRHGRAPTVARRNVMSSTTEAKPTKNPTEGEILKVDFASSISSLFPPLFRFLELFGPDRVLWLGIVFVLHLLYYTTAPRSLLFLLPYPLVYLMPIYMSMTALQRPQDPKGRAFWLSYWVCLLGMDLVEMAVLGRWAQALLYWPGIKVGVALFLIMETTDYSVEPEIDKDLEKRLNTERRNKRRLWTAEAVDKYKIRSDEAKMKVEHRKELEKSKKRPRRFHAFMLVGPFLPDKAHAGGPVIDLYGEPPEPKVDKDGRPVKTFAEQRDEIRDALLDKMERRNETFTKGSGLGNWLDPVMEMGGKIYEQNPFTDERGSIAEAHVKGVAGETPYVTPWASDPVETTSAAVKRGDVPADTASPQRAKDVQRIKFAPIVDRREFPSDVRESTIGAEAMPVLRRQRELLDFAGYNEHPTDEIQKLNSTRVGYRDSATEAMIKNKM
ncbi:hypothetical protein NliqN6_6871 [Naganishia liquefaciens]|uniref:Uncharacterized protein n=1 Tax=Naganishia liquefaciens TaxID=104408 RepID=A0A8H3U298_9TREE|nr:hypothetical protein NliqN6_6871 [Naganishia liquefaciens]